MELQTLQQKLSTQLTNQNLKIVKSDVWCVPVHTVNVSYKPVVRTKMDILMKMLLISVQRAKFSNAAKLSEILLVEELFIHDLLSKMEKTGLLEKGDFYQLTDKGLKQLSNGVYEEDQDITSTELLYSPTHHSFLQGEVEAVLDYEDFPTELFRYQVQTEELDINQKQIIEELRNAQSNDEVSGEQESSELLVSTIDSIEDLQINDVPCIEFIVQDVKGTNHSRIWNTLIDYWDPTLQQLVEKNGLSV